VPLTSKSISSYFKGIGFKVTKPFSKEKKPVTLSKFNLFTSKKETLLPNKLRAFELLSFNLVFNNCPNNFPEIVFKSGI
jgi:hypothetical protein